MKTIVLMVVAGLLATQTFYAKNSVSSPAKTVTSPSELLAGTEERGNINEVKSCVVSGKSGITSSVTGVHNARGKGIDTPATSSKLKLNITPVAPGQYSLQVNFLGYQTKIVNNVNIGSSKEEPGVGILLMWMLFL